MIYSALKRYFGYDTFRPLQEDIVRSILERRDCLVLMPTGGGKSLCYQLPAMLMEGTAVVISPLISLMKDQVDQLAAQGIPAAALNSALGDDEGYRLRVACMTGKVKVLYMSPERALAEREYLLASIKMSMIAIDEAHCISQWGHDFRPEYTQLGALRTSFPGVPVVALTATADKVTRLDILAQLNIPKENVFVSSFDRPNLSLDVRRGLDAGRKRSAILAFLSAHQGEAGIIYCLSRKNTETVAEFLSEHHIAAEAYHAGLPNVERERVQNQFLRDEIQVVVATIAFGMGINKSNVRWVIHYNMPKSIESFYQEIGRAGRDGLPSATMLFYTLGDIVQLKRFVDESGQKEINSEKLRLMERYAESDVCRRRILLNYFGEESTHDCGNCDVCRNPPQRFDGTVLVQKALSAIARTGEQATTGQVVDILRGTYSPEVKQRGWQNLKTFGVGTDVPGRDWMDYMLQMMQMGYFEVAYDRGNRLLLTDAGREVLFGRQRAMLAVITEKNIKTSRTPRAPKAPKIPIFIPAASPDSALLDRLKALRKRLADEQGFPAYIIMSDKVLQAVAQMQPHTVEEFGRVPGIGDYKRDKYGKLFVQAIMDN